VSEFVTDTHPLLWHLLNDLRLSKAAQGIFDQADNGMCRVLIPSIVMVEAIYLAEKQRITQRDLNRLFTLTNLFSINYQIIPLDQAVIRTLSTVPRTQIADMPDRIIAATAKYLEASLITKDTTITASGCVKTIW